MMMACAMEQLADHLIGFVGPRAGGREAKTKLRVRLLWGEQKKHDNRC